VELCAQENLSVLADFVQHADGGVEIVDSKQPSSAVCDLRKFFII
jgi:hypothetical protein